jgi:hypothetical protein
VLNLFEPPDYVMAMLTNITRRFQECESIFVDGDIKLLQTHGDCPKGEIFCSIVGACGKEEACPQKCDRTCTVV